MPQPELVSPATRRAFREIAVGTILREIDGLWRDEGFAPGPENDLDGERRSLYQSYLDAVDWCDHAHVRRALRVFEEQLRQLEPTYRGDAVRKLERDGYRVAEDGPIHQAAASALRPGLMANLPDASAISAGLDRLSRALQDGDAALVIGSAKEVVESTAKVVLRQVGEDYGPKDDLNVLVARAQRALGLAPKAPGGGPDGSEAVRKMLGGAQSVAIGLAELRNREYGTGHGPETVPTGLGLRHAHLALNGARLWCELVLETLEDPQTPWRPQAAPSEQ